MFWFVYFSNDVPGTIVSHQLQCLARGYQWQVPLVIPIISIPNIATVCQIADQAFLAEQPEGCLAS
jgi:hypothetical protein